MCDGHNHKLVEIYNVETSWNEERSVVWCEDCGAVAVDAVSDGIRFRSVVPMKFPKGLYKKIEKGKNL